jgi:hypothetical protein
MTTNFNARCSLTENINKLRKIYITNITIKSRNTIYKYWKRYFDNTILIYAGSAPPRHEIKWDEKSHPTLQAHIKHKIFLIQYNSRGAGHFPPPDKSTKKYKENYESACELSITSP